jgi:hypothetical protein
LAINGNRWDFGATMEANLGRALLGLPIAYEREDFHGDGLRSVLFFNMNTGELPLAEIEARIADASTMTVEEYVEKYRTDIN